jgi:hypothetical protein
MTPIRAHVPTDHVEAILDLGLLPAARLVRDDAPHLRLGRLALLVGDPGLRVGLGPELEEAVAVRTVAGDTTS